MNFAEVCLAVLAGTGRSLTSLFLFTLTNWHIMVGMFAIVVTRIAIYVIVLQNWNHKVYQFCIQLTILNNY